MGLFLLLLGSAALSVNAEDKLPLKLIATTPLPNFTAIWTILGLISRAIAYS
jgi:hypothetical protein